MRVIVAVFWILAGLALAAPPDEKSSPQDGAHKKSAPKKSTQQSLTGCVDEQDGNYLLLDDQMLHKLADLQAVGAGNEAYFAKHLGHKVTVKGSRSSEPDAKFMVTSIEDISAVCAPAQSNPQ